MRKIICIFLGVILLISISCGGDNGNINNQNNLGVYYLNSDSRGCLEYIDNIQNLTVVSKNDNVFKAEYDAGFIQGKLQEHFMTSARDNTWDAMYLGDPSHSYPSQLPPSNSEISLAQNILLENYNYTINNIRNQTDPAIRDNLKRLLFRMLGVYHGANLQIPADLDFSGQWLPEASFFQPWEMTLGYETQKVSWMDVYFLNSSSDLCDVISFAKGIKATDRLSKCSAFVKKVGNDVYISHNTWYIFLDQSMVLNVQVNNDFFTINSACPGIITSMTDFGYNNKGMMFCETTHRVAYTEPKTSAVWTFWRAALAEQYAVSIDDFFKYLTFDNSGTYCNGYIISDAKTKELGLIETSYKCYVYYKQSGNSYDVTTKPAGFSTQYDTELVQPNYILGINYPASYQVRDDLQSTDNRPARRRQFLSKIDGVVDVETAKDLITYTEPGNPLSIFGRWDLGYGETSYPKTIPDGSVDAKVATSNYVLNAMNFSGNFDVDSLNTGFWMKFGSPHVNGTPFVWSESQWKDQKLRDVPDRIDGSFNLMKVYVK
jgi:hypothetical protein